MTPPSRTPPFSDELLRRARAIARGHGTRLHDPAEVSRSLDDLIKGLHQEQKKLVHRKKSLRQERALLQAERDRDQFSAPPLAALPGRNHGESGAISDQDVPPDSLPIEVLDPFQTEHPVFRSLNYTETDLFDEFDE